MRSRNFERPGAGRPHPTTPCEDACDVAAILALRKITIPLVVLVFFSPFLSLIDCNLIHHAPHAPHMIVQVGASSDGTHMKRVPADSLAYLIVDHTRSARDTQSRPQYSSRKVDLLDGEQKNPERWRRCRGGSRGCVAAALSPGGGDLADVRRDERFRRRRNRVYHPHRPSGCPNSMRPRCCASLRRGEVRSRADFASSTRGTREGEPSGHPSAATPDSL